MADSLALFGGTAAVRTPKPVWPILTEEMVQGVVEELHRPQLGRWSNADGGGKIHELEEAFRAYQGTRYALAVSSGTTALDAAMFAVGVEPGDEVLTSPIVPGYAVMPILHFHGRPVFVDIDETSLTMDPASIEAAITPRTRAILVVHLNGHPADMDPILEIARRHSLRVVEDCAHAQGASYKGRLCGSLGSDVACFSLQSVKNLCGGEGGVVTTDSVDLYERALLCGQHPARLDAHLSDPERRKAIATGGLGYNHRMHPLAAVLALCGMPHLDEWIRLRGASARYLDAALREIPGLTPTVVPSHSRHGYYLHTVAYDASALGGLPMARYLEAVRAEGVPAGRVGTPVYQADVFHGGMAFGKGCPLACPHGGEPRDYSTQRLPQMERALITHFSFGFCGFPFDDTTILDEHIEAFRKAADHAEELHASI